MAARSWLLALLAWATTACTWVAPTDAGTEVSVRTGPSESCARVGSVTATTRARVAGVARDATKIAAELDTLARNEATALGANVIVPAGEITDGRRAYDAYRCP